MKNKKELLCKRQREERERERRERLLESDRRRAQNKIMERKTTEQHL